MKNNHRPIVHLHRIGELEEARKARKEEWEKAYANNESKYLNAREAWPSTTIHHTSIALHTLAYYNQLIFLCVPLILDPPPIQEEVPYDPRTLYERLQEQKQKKSDAFAEATKFGTAIAIHRSYALVTAIAQVTLFYLILTALALSIVLFI